MSRRCQRGSSVRSTDAVLLGLGAGQRLRLRESDEPRRQCVGIEKVAIRLAARDLQIDRAVPQGIAGDQFRLDAGNLLARDAERNGEFPQRAFETVKMQVVVDHPSADNRRHFVDSIAEQEAAIEKPDAGLLLRYELTVDIDDPAHLFPLLRPLPYSAAPLSNAQRSLQNRQLAACLFFHRVR